MTIGFLRVIPHRKGLFTVLGIVMILALAGGVRPCAAGGEVKDYLSNPDDWYASEEGKRVTANILSWQSRHGGWPKNLSTTEKPFTGSPGSTQGTFDNGATTDELRFLARAYNATKNRRCGEAFLKGFNHILKAQYPNGGWPQYYPLSSYYHRHITFNDYAMVRIMEFLREVATSDRYAFLGDARRKEAQGSFDRGVQCILDCQIVVNGTKTVWCAQHDEKTLKPRKARSYELVSLSGGESSGILRLLMSLKDPSQEVVDAIVAGAKWYASSKISDPAKLRTMGVDKPGWARFYEIPTNRPIFSGRDGKKKYSQSEIERERAEGYSWWGPYGDKVAQEYKKWKKRHADNPGILIEGTGIIPSELKGPLRLAFHSMGRGQYGPAAATLRGVLDKPDNVGEKHLETARTMMKLIKLRSATFVEYFEKLDKIGDYYTLSGEMEAAKSMLSGLPRFDEKYERWQKEKATDKWRAVIRAGEEYNRLLLAAGRTTLPAIVKRLQDFAARQGDSLYGKAALHVIDTLKANPKASVSAIREAYFKKLMDGR